ncbi:hypothetical protein LCGC14_2224640 [marine sediment metagenome]|uniref:Uncharacterized protein n=1 Tax=marine sediment metagenome TaxID=412755 RepID=A0A0F9DA05_9ZZZZ
MDKIAEAIKKIAEAKYKVERLSPIGVAYPLYKEKIPMGILDQAIALLKDCSVKCPICKGVTKVPHCHM